ncbi:hypothetical protein [Streptomyces sp. B21-101]|uniref:hypothetical protein n=1 Tax=Streptomyces sp. B21-101 TaxID=3039415 RepID=UPI002FF01348
MWQRSRPCASNRRRVRHLIAEGIAAEVFDIPDSRIAASVILSLGIDVARWYHESFRLTPEEQGDE